MIPAALPFDGLGLPSGDGFIVAALPPAARFSFRGRGNAVARAGAAFGVVLPTTPCRAASVGDRHALWLGPDEWMLVAPEGDLSTLPAALSGVPHALVDIAHRNVELHLEGPQVPRLLATQVLLDLDPAAFPTGMVARTVFAKAEIILWRVADTRWRLQVWRSFAPYVVGLLQEAARPLA
jgi:sarcosine oxidase subunit gamma